MANSSPNHGTLAVLLAAGGGTRFVGPTHKLHALVCGRQVSAWALQSVVEASIGPVLIVQGSVAIEHTVEPTSAARSSHDAWGTPTVCVNLQWATGLASSVQCAIKHAETLQMENIVFGLADQPCVPPIAWRDVAHANAPLAVATYDGVRGNPVKVHTELWAQLLSTGDEGARSLLRVHHQLVQEVTCSGSALDVDTVDDLARAAALLTEYVAR
jgi:CTP:molybdopterin cytidylyltransferase MocA